MPTLTAAAPFALTVAGHPPTGMRAGNAPLGWALVMLEGDVFGAAGGDAFYGSPADDPVYGTPIPPGDPGGSTGPDP